MSKLARSAQATFCATFVDELARGGVRHAVVCPGSRSTPMALALASDARIRLQVRLDERSAAFVALGIGLVTGLPAVLLTTSGTAAAEIHAALVEAHEARVPLIACTADRPVELHGVGAPQTIDQAGLYGTALRYACDLGVPDEAARGTWRSMASRLLAEAVWSPSGPGPVHVNVAFREPLDGAAGELPAGRSSGAPWHDVAERRDRADATLADLLRGARRPVIVAGGRAGSPALLRAAAARCGIPLLADPRSGCRRLDDGAGAVVVSTADALLRSRRFAAEHVPDVVVRIGQAWASKVVGSWLAATAAGGTTHVLVDPEAEWRDPGREIATVVRSRPDDLLRGMLEAGVPAGADRTWAASWQEAEDRAQLAIGECLDALSAAGEITEPSVARALASRPEIGTIVVSSSMPVRDLEWYTPPRHDYPTVFANRGANGIDGVVSTTIGVATGRSSETDEERRGPVVGLVGDLAFLHDLSALVRPAGGAGTGFGSGHPCGVVVVDNAGGGIFSFLPQAGTVDGERFEQLFGTPQAADVAALARAAGCAVTEVDDAAGLSTGLGRFLEAVADGGSPVLVCHTHRQRGVAVHDELNQAVVGALGRPASSPPGPAI